MTDKQKELLNEMTEVSQECGLYDKQIIIDGVVVSRCEFYSYIESNKYPHRCSCYEDMYGASVCCDIADCCKNCYYKQLKRKEQECKALREEKAYTDMACEQLEKQLKEKEQECKQLRGKLIVTLGQKSLRQSEKEFYEEQLDQLKAELEAERSWHKTADEISKANSEYTRKLKQTLEKVREIAENAYCLTNATNKDMANFAKHILQICDEVKNEDEDCHSEHWLFGGK